MFGKATRGVAGSEPPLAHERASREGWAKKEMCTRDLLSIGADLLPCKVWTVARDALRKSLNPKC